MRLIRDPSDMQAVALERRGTGVTSVLVPTMGALHEGHLSLIRLAHHHGDVVDVSIFVNPTQFAPGEDLNRYPRTLERDLDLCREEGVGTVFCPEPEAMYPPTHSTRIAESALSSGLCGAYRSGHFDGVVTVVAKLFNIMLPSVAVFGQKDYQQAKVIQRMVRDLDFPVHIVLGPIVREVDGLAMSSRNRYLSDAQRKQALTIFAELQNASARVEAGESDVITLVQDAEAALVAAGLRPQYVSCVDAETLVPVERVERATVLAIAAFAGKTRLIDNVVLYPALSSL